ncbi:hypothetical protein SAY86_005226 [Trapa natans]|uniref:Vacuolar membrane protease n=1 Tax=Trapa natans TaxID=22666 RepID=A0AAN7QVB4_TRANT|nr:hypothetical protein SAY86_005226 [Trapa natans]
MQHVSCPRRMHAFPKASRVGCCSVLWAGGPWAVSCISSITGGPTQRIPCSPCARGRWYPVADSTWGPLTHAIHPPNRIFAIEGRGPGDKGARKCDWEDARGPRLAGEYPAEGKDEEIPIPMAVFLTVKSLGLPIRRLLRLRLPPLRSPDLLCRNIDPLLGSPQAREGAGDCSSCVAVMLELARGVSQWAHGFKNAVIFLFFTGEEEGLNGAHNFITQHPWSKTVCVAIDLEAMGIGGKSGIFQAGPDPWAIENYALVAKYPSGHVIAQDLSAFRAIKWATDFQVYKEIANLSVLDFAYTDNGAVYHTKKLDGERLIFPRNIFSSWGNMLAFLLHIDPSRDLPQGHKVKEEQKSKPSSAIYFDILGMYMVLYNQRFGNILYNSVIIQSLTIWATSLFMGKVLCSSFIRLVLTIYSVSWDNSTNGSLTDRSPGTIPEWLGNVIISTFIALVLSYTSAKRISVFATLLVFSLSVAAVFLGLAPPFSDDTARAVNVVRVVDATTINSGQGPTSYISLFSSTPGKLTKEIDYMEEGFVCGTDKVIDCHFLSSIWVLDLR